MINRIVSFLKSIYLSYLVNFFVLNILIILFLLIFLLIITLVNFDGSKIDYLLFSIISFFLFFYLTDKNSFFIEKFIALYFFIGYWINFSFKISFYSLFPFSTTKYFPEGVGAFDFSSSSYNEVFFVMNFSFLSIILACYFRKKLITLDYQKKFIQIDIKNIYFKKYIIGTLFFFVILISYFNYEYSFFYRGKELANNGIIDQLFNNFIIWIFTFGFICLFSVLIDIYLKNKILPTKLIFVTLFSEFLLNLSILSRGMIFNCLGILAGIKYSFQKIKIKSSVFLYFLFVLFFFIISIFYSTSLRDTKYGNQKILSKTNIVNHKYKQNYHENFKFYAKKIYKIVYSRVHGIEGVMAVQSIRNKDLNLFLESFSVKNQGSFFNDLKNDNRINAKYSSITIPGIVAFLYYTGSVLFVCIFLFALIVLLGFFEKFYFNFTNGNLILTAVLGQIIANRLWHFGHSPLHTYKFIIGILLAIFFSKMVFYLLTKFLRSK